MCDDFIVDINLGHLYSKPTLSAFLQTWDTVGVQGVWSDGAGTKQVRSAGEELEIFLECGTLGVFWMMEG